MDARNSRVAVLLISEDLDGLMELADCVLVMSEGRITYETPVHCADTAIVGHHMCWLCKSDPQLTLLRYEPGASVPRHRHRGLEIIRMLDGEQSDERGTIQQVIL